MRAATPSVLVDQYLLRERIAASGLGVVWRADQRAIVREVPVRFEHPDPVELLNLLSHFRSDTPTADHTAIVTLPLGVAGMPSLLVMEHVAGVSLAQMLRAGEPFSVARAVGIVIQTLWALQQAHAAGIVHADVRPEHVIVEAQPGGGERVTLVDVGGADDDDWVGAPADLAPEVMAGGRPTIASDVYAVGAILYALLVGAPPFDGDSLPEVMTRQLHGIVMPPSLRQRDREIPVAVERATLRALARAPAARFVDAASFATELEAAMRALAPAQPRTRIDRGEQVERMVEHALALSRGDQHAAAIAVLDAAIEQLMWDDSDMPHLLIRLREALHRLQHLV